MHQDDWETVPTPATGGGKATASLVLGIVGMVAWCIPILGLPVSVTGLILGIQAMSSAKRNTAITGVVLCILGLVFTIINGAIGAYLGATGQHPLMN